MSSFVLTDEVREKIQQWHIARIGGNKIIEQLKLEYPLAFSGIPFRTAYELDQLIFGEGAGGGCLSSVYGIDVPEPGEIYIRDTLDMEEIYRIPQYHSGYFTFQKEVILRSDMVKWILAHNLILTPADFCQRFMDMFFNETFPPWHLHFNVLRVLDIMTLGKSYTYSRADYPGAVGEWHYRRGNASSEPIFYHVTEAGTMTCSVEFLSATDVSNWRAPHWHAFLCAELGEAYDPSDSVTRVISALDTIASTNKA